MPADMPGTTAASFPMRLLLVAVGAVLLLVSHAFGATDFSGTWVLDLRSSSSPDPILKRLGASWVERQLGGSLPLESTYMQTPDLLTVHIRGPGFRAVSLRTKDLHDAQLTIVRELADRGKTLILIGTLKITGESGTWALRRVWRKRTS